MNSPFKDIIVLWAQRLKQLQGHEGLEGSDGGKGYVGPNKNFKKIQNGIWHNTYGKAFTANHFHCPMPESGLFVPIVGASQTKRRGDDRHFQNGKPGKVHPSQTGLLEDYLSFFKFKFGG